MSPVPKRSEKLTEVKKYTSTTKMEKVTKTSSTIRNRSAAPILRNQAQTAKSTSSSIKTKTTTKVGQQSQQQFNVFDLKKYKGDSSDSFDGVASDEEPLLYVDVNLGTGKSPATQRIALYANSNPNKVAKAFAKANNIDNNIRENLASLLREQLESALPGV